MALISDDTKQKFQSIRARAEELAAAMGLGTIEEAYALLSTEASLRAAEKAEKMDSRQKKNAEALLRANSALANTLKSNMADSD